MGGGDHPECSVLLPFSEVNIDAFDKVNEPELQLVLRPVRPYTIRYRLYARPLIVVSFFDLFRFVRG